MLAENRIDDGVESDVVGAGRALEQAGMAEHDMVEFVQHEHEEVFVGAAIVGDEAWIQAQARANGAIDASRGYRFIHHDIEQREEFLHLPSGGGNDIINAGSDLIRVHGASPHASTAN